MWISQPPMVSSWDTWNFTSGCSALYAMIQLVINWEAAKKFNEMVFSEEQTDSHSSSFRLSMDSIKGISRLLKSFPWSLR